MLNSRINIKGTLFNFSPLSSGKKRAGQEGPKKTEVKGILTA